MTVLDATCNAIDRVNGALGRGAAWLALLMMLVQFALVLMRYVFGIGSLFLFESIIYAHGILFMTAAAYTLLEDRHVRVDIFYAGAGPRARAWIDLLGSVLFVLPVCAVIGWYAWPYVARSWAVLEGSRETSGIPAVFLLKTFILLFVVTVALQGISMALRSWQKLARQEPG